MTDEHIEKVLEYAEEVHNLVLSRKTAIEQHSVEIDAALEKLADAGFIGAEEKTRLSADVREDPLTLLPLIIKVADRAVPRVEHVLGSSADYPDATAMTAKEYLFQRFGVPHTPSN